MLFIKTHLLYATTQPCDLLLQIEAFSDAVQICRDPQLALDAASTQHEIAGEEAIGTRRWIKAGPLFECHYETTVELNRPAPKLESLTETPRVDLPGPVIKFLLPSRYCHSELFLDFAANQFGDQTGGALVNSMSHWVNSNFTYDNTASHSGTTATDSFASLAGVCRDYAHVLIALVRAAGIPARFVSAYAPDVVPQDFHAVVEVYLEGEWHIVDPTGMANASEIVRICVGRDAADASFLTSYGGIDLKAQSVEVTRITK